MIEVLKPVPPRKGDDSLGMSPWISYLFQTVKFLTLTSRS